MSRNANKISLKTGLIRNKRKILKNYLILFYFCPTEWTSTVWPRSMHCNWRAVFCYSCKHSVHSIAGKENHFEFFIWEKITLFGLFWFDCYICPYHWNRTLFVWDRVLLCSPGWPETFSPFASTPQELGLQVGTTKPGFSLVLRTKLIFSWHFWIIDLRVD
jgi:hypothetical protein